LFASRVFIRSFYKYDREITPEQLEWLYLEADFKSKLGADSKARLKLATERKGVIETVKLIFSKKKK
jgi:hypothetical protein